MICKILNPRTLTGKDFGQRTIYNLDVTAISKEEQNHLTDYKICLDIIDKLLRQRNPFLEPGLMSKEMYSELYDQLWSGNVPGWDYGRDSSPQYFLQLQIPEVANNNAAYYSSHVEPDINDEPHIYQEPDGRDLATIEGYTAQVVGGGTQLYGAVHLRFTPLDLKLQSFNAGRNDLREDPSGDIQREVRDWPITYEDLEPYYCQVEELVGLNGTTENQLKSFSQIFLQTPLRPNPISEFARQGMVQLGQKYSHNGQSIQPYHTPLAVITQDHAPSGRKVPKNPETIKTSYVNRYGDPLGLKSSTWVSLLSPIETLPNFQIWTNCVVTHLDCEGDRIHRIYFKDPAGREKTLGVKPGAVVIVACSAIESVRLLKLSAQENPEFDRRINQNDLLGKYFLTHCFGGAETIVVGNPPEYPPRQFDKSISLDSDWAIDYTSSEAFLNEGTHQHISLEELYYVVEGQSIAYMGVGNDPQTEGFPTVTRNIFGIGLKDCKELPVKAGSIIFTKSGGIHNIRNLSAEQLKFVAFLYHSS